MYFYFILSYFLSSEITKSFTKLNYGVSLSFCNPFQFETKKNINIEKGKQTFALTMVLQLQTSTFCECKTIVSATCNTLAEIAVTKYAKKKDTYDIN